MRFSDNIINRLMCFYNQLFAYIFNNLSSSANKGFNEEILLIVFIVHGSSIGLCPADFGWTKCHQGTITHGNSPKTSKDTVIESDTSKENKEPRYYYLSLNTDFFVNTKGGVAKRFYRHWNLDAPMGYLISDWLPADSAHSAPEVIPVITSNSGQQ
jgi:hypothetical protein